MFWERIYAKENGLNKPSWLKREEEKKKKKKKKEGHCSMVVRKWDQESDLSQVPQKNLRLVLLGCPLKSEGNRIGQRKEECEIDINFSLIPQQSPGA